MITCSPAVLASTRHYEAVCLAPGGSEFFLRSQYEYHYFAFGHSQKVSDIHNWTIRYRPKKGHIKSAEAPSQLQFSAFKPSCWEVGVINGVPFANETFLQPDGTWFQPITIPYAFRLEYMLKKPPHVQQELERLGVVALSEFALLAPHKGHLVYERPLHRLTGMTEGDAIVGAVLHSVSTDQGRSWSEPVFTRNAELYAVGKSNADQPWAARLRSDNRR